MKMSENVIQNVCGEVLYPAPPILPPNEHPRVYFMKPRIPELKKRFSAPVNHDAYARYLAAQAPEARLSIPEGGKNNFDAVVLNNIECRAFAYAIEGKTDMGKSAVSAMREYLERTVGGDYNVLGQIIFTAGTVYDWCYDLMTKEEKDYFCVRTLKIAEGLEMGYPPVKQGSFSGHGVECSLFRDLLVFALAVYDERPDVWGNVAGRLFAEHFKAKDYLYRARMNMQGSHYTAYRTVWEYLCIEIFDAIGYPRIMGDAAENNLDWIIYARRGDGQLLRDGDSSVNNHPLGAYDGACVQSFLFGGNYFKNPYLKWEGLRQFRNAKLGEPGGNRATNPVEFILFNDPDVPVKPHSEFPLSMYFPSPKGAMIARTGWDDGFDSPAVVCEMKINEYWTGNHQHLDAGAFQIYYKAPLAIDTGYYQSAIYSANGGVNATMGNNGNTGYASYHDYGYTKRTIAHNTFIVYDENETFGNFTKYSNDGGQRCPNSGKEANSLEVFLNPENGYKIGRVLGHEFGEDLYAPNYTYIKGDISDAYSDKISDFERSFMFLNLKNKAHPAALVVFDRMVTSRPELKKEWLCHGINPPVVDGSRTTFAVTEDGYNGKMVVDTLLPKSDDLVIDPVTDPANFSIQGVSYKAILIDGANNQGGACRISVSPKTSKNEDYFLNVIQVMDGDSSEAPLAASLIETDKVYGVRIADRAVVFAKAKERVTDTLEFTVDSDEELEITVCGVAGGTWLVNGKEVKSSVEGGVLVFSGKGGDYTVEYKNAEAREEHQERVIKPSEEKYVGLRINGRYVYSEKAPVIDGKRPILPLYTTAKKLGCTVTESGDDIELYCDELDVRVKLSVGSDKITVNGKPETLCKPVTVDGGFVMAPLCLFKKALSADGSYDEFNSVVNISGKVGEGIKMLKYTRQLATKDEEGRVTVESVEATNADKSNPPEKSLDNKAATYAAISGDGSTLTYKLTESVDVSSVGFALLRPSTRCYTVDILTSDDGVNFTVAKAGVETLSVPYDEFFRVELDKPTSARFVRIVNHGYTIAKHFEKEDPVSYKIYREGVLPDGRPFPNTNGTWLSLVGIEIIGKVN